MLQLTSTRSLASPQRNSLLALGTRLRRDLKSRRPAGWHPQLCSGSPRSCPALGAECTPAAPCASSCLARLGSRAAGRSQWRREEVAGGGGGGEGERCRPSLRSLYEVLQCVLCRF